MLNGTWTRVLKAITRLLPHLLAFFRVIKKPDEEQPPRGEPSDSQTTEPRKKPKGRNRAP